VSNYSGIIESNIRTNTSDEYIHEIEGVIGLTDNSQFKIKFYIVSLAPHKSREE
jgi:hypothetical protein